MYSAPCEPERPGCRNRPARFLHLELLGGRWIGTRRGDDLAAWLGLVVSGEDGFTRLGTRRHGGVSGTLYRAPPFSRGGGMFADHLTFIWPRGRLVYAASLHAWEPGREAEVLLERIVTGLRPENDS